MNILTIACFVVGFSEVVLGVMHIRSLSATQVDVDPCLASTLRNISHINERYANLENNCLYTDSRIETAWFYAGVDPIVTSPPSLCRCGYRYPIWMKGALPSPDDGIVNRTACIRNTQQPCSRKLDIKLKNCGASFIYHLTPPPPELDDSGYCFGTDKPGAPKAPDEHKLPNAIVTIHQNETTDNSVTCTVNITATDDNYYATIEFVTFDGLVKNHTMVLDRNLIVYTWNNLSAATNYTIHVYFFNNGGKKEIASAWVVTKAPYRPARAHVDVLQNTITNSGFSSVITFDYGSENKAGYGKLVQQDGVVILTFRVENGSFNRTFHNLNIGTKYMIEVYINIHEERIQLAHESIFTKPEIEVFLKSKPDGEMIRNYTVFKCNFNHSPETTYSVTWFVQSKERNHTIEKTVGIGEEIERLYATEKDLVIHHIALPFNISCKVFEIPNVIKEELSPASTSLFAGIKILTPTITMHRDETASIMISPTIPFSCTILQKTGITSCNLTLAISIPVSKNCTGLLTRKCTITVPGSVGSQSSLQVQATEDGQYGVQKDASHKVILRTIHMLNDSIWRDYTLPAVTVIVKPETSTYWRGKRCEALNDPHMYTFDGKRYEHHEHLSDEYVMYTHESYTAKIHHKLERCNTNAMCNCGVAVQAGRDIYLISTCNNIIEIGYKQCDDGVLLVKKENDYTYTIYLPFGTYVTARIDKTPYYNSVWSMIVSVSVYPSVHDQFGRSKGLCGTLDRKQANDFHDREGQTLLNKTDFILAWKVPKEQSLFGSNSKSTLPWQHPACSCTATNGHVTTNDKCRLGADNSCAKGQTVGEKTCKLAERISIDSSKTQSVPVLDLSKHMTTKGPSLTTTPAKTNTLFPKTQVPTSTPVHWNTVEATSFCTTFLNRSRAFRLCARVPDTDTNRAIETCTQDILITQTTEWHKLSRQSMQDACISEIHRNKTVREHLEPPRMTTPSPTPPDVQHNGHVSTLKPIDSIIDSNLDINQLIDTIEEIACPNECSDNGNCKNGTCECNPWFGGDDCSIDFKQAPSTASFLHGSVCDEKEAPCTHVFIHGGLFASETVSCHITTFETHAGKKGRQNLDAYVIRGQAESLIEVICPLTTPIRRKRSVPKTQDVKLLSCFKVAVSNDGIHHGSPISMCVYNSECQSLINDDNGLLTAKIKRGFCYIDGKCVSSNEREPSSETYCVPSLSLYSWSELPNSTETSSTVMSSASGVPITHNTDNIWHTAVIIAGVCVCCLCLIVGIVVYIRKRKQRKTVDGKKEKEGPEFPKEHDADFDEETYAHINPVDVTGHVSYGVKTLNLNSDVGKDYARLDTTKKEKVQYAKLNATQIIKRESNGPMLPDRPCANPEDPYEKLQSENRDQQDYEKMKNNYRNLNAYDRSTNPRGDRNSSDESNEITFKLDNNQARYLAPTRGFDGIPRNVQINLTDKGQRNDDVSEGYERPDPLYKRY